MTKYIDMEFSVREDTLIAVETASHGGAGFGGAGLGGGRRRLPASAGSPHKANSSASRRIAIAQLSVLQAERGDD